MLTFSAYVLITPARNEAQFIERTVKSAGRMPKASRRRASLRNGSFLFSLAAEFPRLYEKYF